MHFLFCFGVDCGYVRAVSIIWRLYKRNTHQMEMVCIRYGLNAKKNCEQKSNVKKCHLLAKSKSEVMCISSYTTFWNALWFRKHYGFIRWHMINDAINKHTSFCNRYSTLFGLNCWFFFRRNFDQLAYFRKYFDFYSVLKC